MYKIIDGKKIAEKYVENLKQEIDLMDKKPCLAVVLVGEDAASQIYVNNKNKKALALGMKSLVVKMPANISENELLNKIDELNNDEKVTAILVQLPLPEHINSQKIIEAIDIKKDVDGFNPYNIGKIAQNKEPIVYPCTPLGIIKLLDEYEIDVAGKNVVVIGRSNIVGKPISLMLMNKNATVTVAHSKTQNLKEVTSKADILICATGQPQMVKADWVKQNAVIIDVGIRKGEDNKLVGDVDFEQVKEKCSFITPVPGGVGPMTIAMLMQNTVELHKKRNM